MQAKPNTVQVSINLKTNKATVKQTKARGPRATGVKKKKSSSSDAQFDASLRKRLAEKKKKQKRGMVAQIVKGSVKKAAAANRKRFAVKQG
tara:strand:- start:1160 stop:1432 length:273 start_codon:yes stop_codon:yes gene_type:complete